MFLRHLFQVFSTLLFISPALVQAQEAVPDHKYNYSRNIDFYGSDLDNLFDTTLAACARACSSNEACLAFTFNTLKGACFPKSDVTNQVGFEGALSALKIRTDAEVIRRAEARVKDLEFLTDADISLAVRTVRDKSAQFNLAGYALPDLITSFEDAFSRNDILTEERSVIRAIALSERSDLWARLAEIGLRNPENLKSSERNRLRRQAVPAAINAYLRAPNQAQQITTAELLARALESNRRGRDMIPALRLATALQPRPDLLAQLDGAIAKYGFRIVEHSAENNAAAPRICAEFSEKLVQAGVDYEPFIMLRDPGLVVQANGQQICIDGVKHGERYTVTFRKGLPAASGETLHKNVDLTVYVRDRSPSVRFTGRAFVLPRSTKSAIPVDTVNADTLTLTLRKVSDRNLLRTIQDNFFGKPLNKYQEDQFSNTLAQTIWTGEGKVQNTLNANMTTRLPLGDALADQPPGIYTLSAAIPGQDPYDSPAATQWFVLTDLGLSSWSGVDGVHVAVRSLTDATPHQGITLSLISQSNAVLAKVATDDNGFATFPAGLARGTGASAPALIMADQGGTDVAFLPLTGPAFDLSDRGVEGRAPSPPIDTFMTTDRGAYRVGETIFVTALTRDTKMRGLNGLPMVAVLKRPDGVEYSRTLSQNSKAGGHIFALPLGASVPRGAWRVDIIANPKDGPLASRTVLVEDFLPERIDFELALPNTTLRLTDTPPLLIQARYLFGAPGADLAIEGSVRLRATQELEAYQGYRFGRHTQRFSPRTAYLETARTDAEGNATLTLKLPKLDETPSQPLIAKVTVRVSEGSGRPVERQLSQVIVPDTPLIGIKPSFDDVLAEGADARFDLITTSDTPMAVKWTVNRIQTRYQWYQTSGNWNWEPTTRRTRIDTGEVTLTNTPTAITVPTNWGQYEVVVEHLGSPYVASSFGFSSGWYGGDGASDTPDRLEVSLNQPDFAPGDTAQLRIVAPDAGTALVSVLSNRVIERKSLAVNKGENLIPFTVGESWGSGVYITAAVLRPMNEAEGLNPTRSLGVAHAAVRPGIKKLAVEIDVPNETDGQAGQFTATVNVAGIAPGDTAYVTLAAVDLGILNLTNFKSPDPSSHYFGQRRLGVDMRDVYGRLIDGLNGAMGSVRSGGDAAGAADMQSPPPTEKLMAFFSGSVTVGADGRAVIKIDRPAFNGTVRLMAMAWSDGGVGQASLDMIARDPIVISASVPRLLAPGDESRMLLELVHATGPSGEVALKVFADAGLGLDAVPATITLADQGTVRLSLPMRARKISDNKITIHATTPDGKTLEKTIQLGVRDNDPEVATTQQFSLGAGQTFRFDSNVFDGLRAGTANATLTAGPLARFDVPGLLRQLDRYPYGCTEQVTSAAMPLLYLSSFAEAAGIGAPSTLDKKIKDAIERVLSRQASNGAFGLWRAQSGEFWLDAYVTDFLWRASKEGHTIPPRALSQAMDNLRNRISYAPDFDDGGEDIAYALLVLARAGAAQMGDLRYYADTKADSFGTPLAVAQLGAALAAYGDPLRADRMFAKSGVMLAGGKSKNGWRQDFGTSLRDTAGVLKLSAEAGSTAINPAKMAQLIRFDTRRLSTQEAAQVVMAAHALGQNGTLGGVLVDGVAPTGPLVKRLEDTNPQTSEIQNTSTAPIAVTMTTYGVPEIAPDQGGYGYAIKRRYFTMDGDEVTGQVASGTRLVAVLEVQPFEKTRARLMIDDPLPGGFEIDNPNLLRGGDVKALDWLKPIRPEHVEFRADRFLAAVTYAGTKPITMAYIVRAVTPGSYHHSAATVSDMYRPEYRANTATGAVTVTP